MIIRFLRHATFSLEYEGLNFLIDPMMGLKGTKEAIANSPNPRRNPLTPLPLTNQELLSLIHDLDSVIVTHTHSDHWDEAAREALPKSLRFFCQPEDVKKIRSAGFKKVQAAAGSTLHQDIEITRTGGQHGVGEIGRLMAPVSGFVLKTRNEPSLYIAGDTIWCEEVSQVIAAHKPEVIILNSGAAQFLEGGPITMTAQDVARTCEAAPAAEVVAVHMEAINHCVLSRDELRKYLRGRGLETQVIIPEDGQEITF